MSYITDYNIKHNLQVYFRNNILLDLENDDRVWAERFRLWLLEQGAVIELHPGRLLRNSLGIAPLYDKLAFEDEGKLIVFSLRWS